VSPSLPPWIGRYEVAEMIGAGAFATVYRARDNRLDADVAVKVLAENHSFDADLRERFISEGHLLRRVDSPNVVKVFDLGETEAGQPFLVLDLASGGDLAERRRALGPRRPDPDDVLAVAHQVATALSALHGERVVHRDITPSNLLIGGRTLGGPATSLVGPGERLMLADLGLSKDLAATSGLTVGAGTAGFTPPEQGAGGWIDARADIWSASALLVWLILGSSPQSNDDWRAEIRSQGWPQPVIRELDRGLASDPARRHPTAGSWFEALSAAAAPPPAPVRARTPGSDRWTARRHRLPTALLALLLLAAACAGGWWLGRSRGSAGTPYGRVRVEQLPRGQVRSTAGEGSARVTITGPGSMRVGQRATYAATTQGLLHSQWLAPDGQSYLDEPKLVIEPTSAGVATVRLLGQTAKGDVSIAELRVTVRSNS